MLIERRNGSASGVISCNYHNYYIWRGEIDNDCNSRKRRALPINGAV